jgi:hypothetical protein
LYVWFSVVGVGNRWVFLSSIMEVFQKQFLFVIGINKASKKIWKFDVDNCVLEHHWPIINYHITDVIKTYKVMILH